MKVPYFPFSGTFDLRMGTAPLPPGQPVVEIDEHYQKEIQLKKDLLTENHRYYFQTVPESDAAQWEVLAIVLRDLHKTHPQQFSLSQQADKVNWSNHITGEHISFCMGDASSLPFAPLDFAGRQVQEDLLILNQESLLVAGQLCFASGWCLDEKMGQHFLTIHGPLPRFMDGMMQSAGKLIDRIPMNRPIGRTNWGFRLCDQLDLSTRHRESYRALMDSLSPGINTENAGEKIFFRIERQTLSRLSTGHVLFTIHTYNSLLKEEAHDRSRASAMLSFVETVPADLIDYKLMTSYRDPLIGYLKSVIG